MVCKSPSFNRQCDTQTQNYPDGGEEKVVMQQAADDIDPPQQTNAPFQSHSSSPAFDMSDKSGSPRLHVLFQAALEDYEKQTGIKLTEHPLAERLQDISSVDDVTDILRIQATDLENFREKDKVLKPLKKVLTVLHIISSIPSVADFTQHVGLVCPQAPTGCSTSLTLIL